MTSFIRVSISPIHFALTRRPSSLARQCLLRDRKRRSGLDNIVTLRDAFGSEEPVWYARRCNVDQSVGRSIIEYRLELPYAGQAGVADQSVLAGRS